MKFNNNNGCRNLNSRIEIRGLSYENNEKVVCGLLSLAQKSRHFLFGVYAWDILVLLTSQRQNAAPRTRTRLHVHVHVQRLRTTQVYNIDGMLCPCVHS